MRELLFTLDSKDFKWDFFKTSGPGGQNKNKRDTACRCTHIASGAAGIGSEEREQRKNRILAFEHCINSQEFKAWHRIECNRIMMDKNERRKITQEIDSELLNREHLLIEVRDKNGNWVEACEQESEMR